MKKKTIKTLIFLPFAFAALYLGYSVYASIKDGQEQYVKIKTVDALVIQRLKDIREVEKLHLEATLTYADNWEDLVEFAKNGTVYRTQITENVITLPSGRDSINTIVDTISTEKAYDILEKDISLKYSELNKLPVVPISKDTFDLYANALQGTWVIEVTDPNPVNPRRQANGDLKPLKIGSKAQSITKGNWE